MHIERIEGASTSFLQALVRFPDLPASEPWWASYKRRMLAIPALGDITSAYRLGVTEDGSIDRLLSVVFAHDKEQPARRFFGSFSFLEGLVDDSVALPTSASEFEAWAGDFPKLKGRVVPPPFRTPQGRWLSCDFRVAPHLEILVREAQLLGFAFSYQIHFRPFSPDPELLRRVQHNLLELRDAKGIPAEIVADQKRQVNNFQLATLLVEEIIATNQTESAKWLADALDRAFRADPLRARLGSPELSFSEDHLNFDPVLMMHTSLLYGDWTEDDLHCSQAAQESFRSNILCYRPAVDQTRRRRLPDSGTGVAQSHEPPLPFPPDLTLPTPFEGRGHIFISYRRSDLPRIAPILERLMAEGLPIWYDRGIFAGDEWDVVLERKIEEASLMLAFLSQAAVDSKYCRREIKFADAINKPLLVVVLEVAPLSHGLKFLLQQLQQINVADPEFDLLLDRAINKVLNSNASGT